LSKKSFGERSSSIWLSSGCPLFDGSSSTTFIEHPCEVVLTPAMDDLYSNGGKSGTNMSLNAEGVADACPLISDPSRRPVLTIRFPLEACHSTLPGHDQASHFDVALNWQE
jgi:hypothetical protein